MEQQVESSINKMLAQLQLANAAIIEDKCEDEDSFEVLLREALKSENEAIEIYIKLKQKSEILGSQILVKAFNELKKDEQEHIGNLNYLKRLLCENAIENEDKGETEEAKLQAEVSVDESSKE